MATRGSARRAGARCEETPVTTTSVTARATIEAGAVVLLVDGDLEGARDLYAPLVDFAKEDDRLAPLWAAVSRLADLAGSGLDDEPAAATAWPTLRIMGEDLATLYLRMGSYAKAAEAYQRLVREHPFDSGLARALDDVETVLSYLARIGLVHAATGQRWTSREAPPSDETTLSRSVDLELEPTSERPTASPRAGLGLDQSPTVVEHRGRFAESHLIRWFQRRAAELCACSS